MTKNYSTLIVQTVVGLYDGGYPWELIPIAPDENAIDGGTSEPLSRSEAASLSQADTDFSYYIDAFETHHLE